MGRETDWAPVHSVEQSTSTSPAAASLIDPGNPLEENAPSLESSPEISQSYSMGSECSLRLSPSTPDYRSISHISSASRWARPKHPRSPEPKSGNVSWNQSTRSPQSAHSDCDPAKSSTATRTQKSCTGSNSHERTSSMSPSRKYSRFRHDMPAPEGMCRRYSTEYFPRGDGLFTDVNDASVAIPVHKAALDTLFTYFIGMVVALWWRSSWYLMDKHFVVDGTDNPITLPNALFSLCIGLGVMTVCIELRGFLIRRANSAHPCSDVSERIFTLAMGLAAVAQWRGAWYLGDLYFSDNNGAVTNTLIMNISAAILLIAFFSLKSVVTGVFLDGSGYNFYTFYEAWKVGNTNIERVKRACRRIALTLRDRINRDSSPSATSPTNHEESLTNDGKGGAGHESSATDTASPRGRLTEHTHGSAVELQARE